jgi:geranylgeranyl transferase type-1 subunit beta
MTRHVEYIGSDEEEDEEEQEKTAKMSLYPGNGDEDMPSASGLSLEDKHFIGCNGRVNKRPDTCYSFWVGASLDVSQEAPLVTCFMLRIVDDWPG